MASAFRLSVLVLGLFSSLTNAFSLQVHDSSFVPDFILRISFGTLKVACTTRPSVLVNGTSPGPALRIPAGKATWVRVYNDMSDSNFTMHWHGISQRMAIFSDGTPQASQWPIPPLHFFDYEIQPETGDAGTYFYHSHVGFQAVSAHGPLIVTDSGTPPYTYDDERTFFLTDFYNRTDADIEAGLVSPMFKFSGEPNALLVNGKGITNYNPNRADPACTVPVFDVDPGKTYRFRMVDASALVVGTVAIQNHTGLQIIAADAQYTKPSSVDYLQIATGQRFDFLLKTKTATQLKAEGNKGYYWIGLISRERPPGTPGYALLRYNKSVAVPPFPTTMPVNLPNFTTNYLEYTLQPLTSNNFPTASQVTRRLQITVVQTTSSKNMTIWVENKLYWAPEIRTVPYLVDIYKRGQAAIPSFARALQNMGWDPQFQAYPANKSEVLEIIIQNSGTEANFGKGTFDVHPFHAHGGHYYDIGSGNGTYNAAANEQKLSGYNPVLRDTTMLYSYSPGATPDTQLGWRAWRLRVEDVGVWMVHCHFLAHMIMGMQNVFVMGNAAQIQAIPEPYVSGYLDYGGSAYGNRTYSPNVLHQFKH